MKLKINKSALFSSYNNKSKLLKKKIKLKNKHLLKKKKKKKKNKSC
jgi:hypothetical protein